MACKECNICCSRFTDVKRLRCKCEDCDFEFCSECLKNDFKTKKGSLQELSCFNCKKPFSQKFLRSVFSKTFFQKEVLSHLTEIQFDKEYKELYKAQSLATYDIAHKNWKNILKEQQNEMKKISSTISLLHSTRPIPPEFVEEEQVKTKKCPIYDCRGFLNEKFVCESCDKRICESCEEEFLEGHVCDEDTLKTIEEKNKNSKPCPKCNISISKTDGCNQMWCPMCNTVFDYSSGKIDTSGYIHNPEYLAHMRKSGHYIPRARGDVRFCDDLTQFPSYSFTPQNFIYGYGIDTSKGLETEVKKQSFEKKIVSKLHDLSWLISDIKNYLRSIKTSEELKITKRQLQADFINKKITEKDWKSKLKRIIKCEEQNNEFKEICNSYMLSINDVLSNCVEISLKLGFLDEKKFDDELIINVYEICAIHTEAMVTNRKEIAAACFYFFPKYLEPSLDSYFLKKQEI